MVFVLLTGTTVFSQSPLGLNYQAIARDMDYGNELQEQNIIVEFQVRQGNPSGVSVYSETHSTLTDQFGLFTLMIGQGDPLSGDFQNINWGSDTFFLATLIDDGSGLEEIGSMQFLSVPYALHANTVTNSDDADADPTNETNLSINFDPTNSQLEITDLSGTLNADLSSLQDADADPTNELIDTIGLSGTEVMITENGVEHNVDLASLIPEDQWTNNGIGGVFQTGTEKVGIGELNSSPNSTLDIDGSVSFNTTINSGNNVTVNATGHYYLIENTGNVFVQLPNPTSVSGRHYVFILKNDVSGSVNFTSPNPGIQGAPSIAFNASLAKKVYSVISFGFEGWRFVDNL